MSPQSIDRAQRPVVNRPRVPPTSMLSSSGGPNVAVFAYVSSALVIASLGPNSGFMFEVSKNAPSLVPLALEQAGRDRDDPPVALGALLLGDARAVVRLAVAVEVLAVVLLGDREVVVPGLRRRDAILVEDVLAVIDHVEVAVERDRVDLAVVGRVEVPEERADVLPVELGIVVHAIGQVGEVARADEVAQPLRVEHVRVEGVRARSTRRAAPCRRWSGSRPRPR